MTKSEMKQSIKKYSLYYEATLSSLYVLYILYI